MLEKTKPATDSVCGLAVADYRAAAGAGRPASGRLQHGGEASCTIRRDQVIAAAHVGLADEDLRHGAPTGQIDHAVALGRVEIHGTSSIC